MARAQQHAPTRVFGGGGAVARRLPRRPRGTKDGTALAPRVSLVAGMLRISPTSSSPPADRRDRRPENCERAGLATLLRVPIVVCNHRWTPSRSSSRRPRSRRHSAAIQCRATRGRHVFTQWLPIVATHHLIPTAAQQVGRRSLGRGGRGRDWRRDVIPDFRYFRAAGARAVPCGLLY